jgi:hypothetical protein
MMEVDGGVAVPFTSEKTTSVVAEVGYRKISQNHILHSRRLLIGIRYNID